MKLYTERHGIRSPKEKTYSINKDVYSLLLNSCINYEKNLTHIFSMICHDNFTDSDYTAFDERTFDTKIKIRIPTMYRDEFGRICAPNDDQYDQFALIDFIEFFAQNIQDISEYWNNDRYKNYKTIDCLETSNVYDDFQNEINDIFQEAGVLYVLTDNRIVERVVENTPLTQEMEDNFDKVKEKGIKDLLKDAIELYKTPNHAARQDSIEKIWDALERLKTYYDSDKKRSVSQIVDDMAHQDANYQELFDREFRALTDIGNQNRIRHHETDKIEIIDEKYCDYLFNRCLSLIALAVQYLK